MIFFFMDASPGSEIAWRPGSTAVAHSIRFCLLEGRRTARREIDTLSKRFFELP
jgi:hypothetical protein